MEYTLIIWKQLNKLKGNNVNLPDAAVHDLTQMAYEYQRNNGMTAEGAAKIFDNADKREEKYKGKSDE